MWDDHAVELASHFFFPVLLPSRDARDRFRAKLAASGVQTTWYPALHTFTDYRDAGSAEDLPGATEAGDRHCALPLSSTMHEAALRLVVQMVRAALA